MHNQPAGLVALLVSVFHGRVAETKNCASGGLRAIQLDVGAQYREDLPAVSISRLRALGVITAETTEFHIKLGHVEQDVSVHLRRFPSGGSWSWFGCPTCGKWVRTLRLHLDDIVCPGCCKRRGIRPRADPMSVKQRAERRIPQLRAMLESPTSLRLKPVLWGKMERRSRHEAALARCEYIVGRSRKFRDVVTEEIPPEPIARPKLKTTLKTKTIFG